MICAAKNDEKEMFEKLVQNATEAKNLPDNFIGSIIDDENHSLLHFIILSFSPSSLGMKGIRFLIFCNLVCSTFSVFFKSNSRKLNFLLMLISI
jgi:hypothetical protein